VPAARRLRAAVGIEVAATAVISGLSAALVQVEPGPQRHGDRPRTATTAYRRR
jgi:hypothetical protein